MYEIIDKSEKFYSIVCKETKDLNLIYSQLSKFPDRYSIDETKKEVKFYKSMVNIQFVLNSLDIYIFKNDIYYQLLDSLDKVNVVKLEDYDIQPEQFEFKTKPWKHQLKMFKDSCHKQKYALFLEQRLGKTKISLDTAAYLYLNKKINTLVVIAPNIVHSDWVKEAAKEHLSVPYNAFVWSSHNNKIEAEDINKVFYDKDKLNIFAINKESTISLKGQNTLEYIIKHYKCMVVVDECHAFKNPNAKTTGALFVMLKKAVYTRLLSGTPIGNALTDLYSQFSLLDKNILGYSSFSAFRKFCEQYPDVAKQFVYEKIKNYFCRMTLRECFTDIPEIMDIPIKFQLSDKQKQVYKEIIENNFVADNKDATLFKNIIIKLQQIISGYYIDTEGNEITVIEDKKNPKIIAMNELIEKVEGKIIIWTKFKKEVVDICKNLDSKYKFVTYTGNQSTEEKIFAKEQFKTNPEVKIIVINIQSGAEGLTLPEANTAIYYSNTYSFLKRDQSEKRFILGDNKEPKTCYNLCAIATLDIRILWLLKQKKQLLKEIIDRKDDMMSDEAKDITKEEMIDLINYNEEN